MKNDFLVETMDKSFYDFMCTRQDSTFQSSILKDKKYNNVKSKISKVLEEINTLIPRELYLELDDLICEEEFIEKDYMYRQGFFDGIRLMQIQNEPIKYRCLDDEEEGGCSNE